VIGCGNIGSALIKYKGFENEGIKIIAGFDLNPASSKKTGDIPILPLEDLKDFVIKNKIRIGIIAVPDMAAQQVLDTLVTAGIEGILNFAPIRLRAPENIVINNVNLGLELENVIYFVNAVEKTGTK
jgi:redox-sensing transcriptional repressor